jgi:hypothetical protein
MRARAALGLLALAVTVGCRGAKPRPARPFEIVPLAVATPEQVAAGDPVAIECAFHVGGQAPGVTGSYRVFVHLLDREGALLAADDYLPQPPVSQWQAGKTYGARRIVLTPEFPYAGEVAIVTGLYAASAAGERLALAGRPLGRRAYRAGRLTLAPRRRELALDCEGLYAPEATPEAPLLVTRFMGRTASCRFSNPAEDVLLFLSVDLEPQGFTAPPRLTLATDTGRALQLPLPLESEPRLLRVRIAASALGRRELAGLRLTTSAGYVPRELGVSGDPRELSLRIRGARLLRASAAPPALVEGALELGGAQ